MLRLIICVALVCGATGMLPNKQNGPYDMYAGSQRFGADDEKTDTNENDGDSVNQGDLQSHLVRPSPPESETPHVDLSAVRPELSRRECVLPAEQHHTSTSAMAETPEEIEARSRSTNLEQRQPHVLDPRVAYARAFSVDWAHATLTMHATYRPGPGSSSRVTSRTFNFGVVDLTGSDQSQRDEPEDIDIFELESTLEYITSNSDDGAGDENLNGVTSEANANVNTAGTEAADEDVSESAAVTRADRRRRAGQVPELHAIADDEEESQDIIMHCSAFANGANNNNNNDNDDDDNHGSFGGGCSNNNGNNNGNNNNNVNNNDNAGNNGNANNNNNGNSNGSNGANGANAYSAAANLGITQVAEWGDDEPHQSNWERLIRMANEGVQERHWASPHVTFGGTSANHAVLCVIKEDCATAVQRQERIVLVKAPAEMMCYGGCPRELLNCPLYCWVVGHLSCPQTIHYVLENWEGPNEPRLRFRCCLVPHMNGGFMPLGDLEPLLWIQTEWEPRDTAAIIRFLRTAVQEVLTRGMNYINALGNAFDVMDFVRRAEMRVIRSVTNLMRVLRDKVWKKLQYQHRLGTFKAGVHLDSESFRETLLASMRRQRTWHQDSVVSGQEVYSCRGLTSLEAADACMLNGHNELWVRRDEDDWEYEPADVTIVYRTNFAWFELEFSIDFSVPMDWDHFEDDTDGGDDDNDMDGGEHGVMASAANDGSSSEEYDITSQHFGLMSAHNARSSTRQRERTESTRNRGEGGRLRAAKRSYHSRTGRNGAAGQVAKRKNGKLKKVGKAEQTSRTGKNAKKRKSAQKSKAKKKAKKNGQSSKVTKKTKSEKKGRTDKNDRNGKRGGSGRNGENGL